jgi:D-2-hydroxyacid dehydrogenase (NADP+)
MFGVGLSWSRPTAGGLGDSQVVRKDVSMSGDPSQPLALLLSGFALRLWGARIQAAVPDCKLDFVDAEEAFRANAPCAAGIAFMTREVTGNSTSNNQTRELREFEAVLRNTPGLRWLQIHPAGAERQIYRELRARGVKVTTGSGATAVTVGHSTLGAVIALNRRFPLLADAQRRHAWEPCWGERAPRDLKGQCAVIVGLGPVGRNIAALLKVLGMGVIGVRRNPGPVEPCDETTVYGRLLKVLPRADWLILCCPASPLTQGLVDAAALAAMPAGALLVNVARGEVVVERDLIAALASGKLGGAYLDVFEKEPLDPASPLWDMHNVLISPHTAGHSQGQQEAVLEIFLDNLRRWCAGDKLRNDADDLR